MTFTAKEASKASKAAIEEKKADAQKTTERLLPEISKAIQEAAGSGTYAYRIIRAMNSYTREAVIAELRLQGYSIDVEQDNSLMVRWPMV